VQGRPCAGQLVGYICGTTSSRCSRHVGSPAGSAQRSKRVPGSSHRGGSGRVIVAVAVAPALFLPSKKDERPLVRAGGRSEAIGGPDRSPGCTAVDIDPPGARPG
jgi:hypothetical protein